MLQILVLEDNRVERDYLCMLISKIVPEARLYPAETAEEALRLMELRRMDIFFLDVGLPGETDGFQLADRIRESGCYLLTPIVFVTARRCANIALIYERFHQYAYIDKPVDSLKLKRALGTFLPRYNAAKKLEETRRLGKEKIIFLELKRGVRPLRLNDVCFAEVMDHKLWLMLRDGELLEGIRMSLCALVEQIHSPFFVQCHRSYAVNLNHIIALEEEARRRWRAVFDTALSRPCFVSSSYYGQVAEGLKGGKEEERRGIV